MEAEASPATIVENKATSLGTAQAGVVVEVVVDMVADRATCAGTSRRVTAVMATDADSSMVRMMTDVKVAGEEAVAVAEEECADSTRAATVPMVIDAGSPTVTAATPAAEMAVVEEDVEAMSATTADAKVTSLVNVPTTTTTTTDAVAEVANATNVDALVTSLTSAGKTEAEAREFATSTRREIAATAIVAGLGMRAGVTMTGNQGADPGIDREWFGELNL